MLEIYKWLWTRLGGRPWTYIMREYIPKHPLITILVSITIGMLVQLALTSTVLLIAVIAFSAGLLLGHLFWDTSGGYIKKRVKRG